MPASNKAADISSALRQPDTTLTVARAKKKKIIVPALGLMLSPVGAS